MGIIKAIYFLVRAFFVCRLSLAVENVALRQQLAVYKHSVKRPKLRPRDRVFWVWLSRLWSNWRSALAIVQPETVIQWHRQGFKLYWRWKSQAGEPGRPLIVLNERHLHRILSNYFDYYHNSRPHLSLDRNSPTPRRVELPSEGQVVAVPQVGGLHHRYTRRAA
jgi:hypothetical protein